MPTLCQPSRQPRLYRRWLFLLAALLFSVSPSAFAVTGELDLTASFVGFFALAIFVLAWKSVV